MIKVSDANIEALVCKTKQHFNFMEVNKFIYV